MDAGVWKRAFYDKIRDDNRISPFHISLYFALVFEAGLLTDVSFVVRREAVMSLAKISSRVTYHRCLRELHWYGYIEYRASFAAGQSMVRLIPFENSSPSEGFF